MTAMRTRRLAIAATLATAAVLAAVPSVAVSAPVLPPCPTEDSTGCLWDAQHQGNGRGRSFLDVAGRTYYLDDTAHWADRLPTYEHAASVCQTRYMLAHSAARDVCVDVLADLVAAGVIARPAR